ncbi:NAD(P)/FAD-dependent oxidoreductase [Sneathiella glossodoripedis]|uniref:NAD(P)/FAD-dependent oxidoreductase n=1 Tax=Sneathiella glossodoripedis TaxID=418853 RepID=UPI00046F6598|nr:FAD-binding oxidoreductase [Sneathiella glossodoripedis]
MKKENNYYRATANKSIDCPSLDGDITADVCIIGAGFTGLGTALELSTKGLSVVVLEAGEIAEGASGRSGGQIASGYSCGMMETENIVGPDDARHLWAFSEEAKQILHERISSFKIECDYQDGELYAAPKESHAKWLRKEQEFVERNYGYNGYRWLDTSAMRQTMAGSRYVGALLDVEGGHIHPLNYSLGMADAALKRGVQIYTNTRAKSYTEQNGVKVVTDTGSVTAKSLVLAGNAYLRGVAPALEWRMVPITSSILATEPLGQERRDSLMRSTACVADTNFDLDYFKFTTDTRLVYGAQDLSFGRSTPQNNAVCNCMLKTFPMLDDVKVDYFWNGQVSVTRKRLPDLGRLGKYTYYAHGYSGQGVPLSAVVSRILAEAVAGDMGRLDVFERIPHSFIPKYRFAQLPIYYTILFWNRLKDLL